MGYKIISDSSSNILDIDGIAFESVPLKIITDEREYIDNDEQTVNEMISDLARYKGTSKTSCPNVDDWKKAFCGADNIFCVTITSNLSGSFNAASLALNDYLAEFPEKKGYVIDTLSTGPENALIIEKIKELIEKGLTFDEIKEQIIDYNKNTHLIFCLDSLRNLANNGRVSTAVAKISGILGIRVVGKASDDGVLEIVGKAKGSKKALTEIFKNMIQHGYSGGKVRIHHCQNENAAQSLSSMIKEDFPDAEIIIRKTGALCSFYAESGGLLVGFEG